MKKIVRFLSVVGLSALVATFAQAQDVNNASGYVQVYDVASVSNLPLNEYKQYHKEGDIADVSYLFWSSLGKMKVKIENTTDAPIYVNWSKSTYTVEGIELPMTPIENELPDVQYKHFVRYKASDPTITDMDYEWQKIAMGREEKKDEISEILPKGTYTKGNYYLVANDKRVDKGIVLDTASANYSEKHNVKKNEKATIYKQESTQENSPVKFTCKLVIATDKSFKDAKIIEESFYVSCVREMDAKHFRGKKVGQDPEGYGIYKFPERKGTSFFIEINPRNSVEFNKRYAR